MQKFHFSPTFDVTIDPEFPGDGDWRCPTYGFGRDGRQQETFTSPWGAPIVIEVILASGERWVGQFEAGGLGGTTGVFATPKAGQICVLVDGLAYVLEVDAAYRDAVVAHDQVGQVEAIPNPDLLLLVSLIDIVAVGPDGLAWESQRLALYGLRIENTADDVITCSSLDTLGGTSFITLAATTGEQLDGTRFDSFSPPDALA